MAEGLIKFAGDDIEKIERAVLRDNFLQVVNTPPPQNWVRDHPVAKGVKYMPIEKIELLLTRIFQEWRVEIVEVKQIMNSLMVSVRLHYKDPLTNEWTWQDGVGAVPAKTDKGSSAADMSKILSDAVMTGLPAAESYAVKDAAEKIGKVFGKDLNRKDTMAFSPSYAKEDVVDDLKKRKEELKEKIEAKISTVRTPDENTKD